MLNTSSDRAAPAGRVLHAAARLLALRRSRIAASRERERLRILLALQLLDTAREPFLDAVVASAATIANTPIAALSLVDVDRQWFKGSVGIDVAETPLDASFCRHAVGGTEPLVVPDTRRDPRFADSPAVTGDMHVRFYAGFPLSVGGLVIGAVCVADDHPRSLTSRQRQRLVDLTAGAIAWIETHAAKAR